MSAEPNITPSAAARSCTHQRTPAPYLPDWLPFGASTNGAWNTSLLGFRNGSHRFSVAIVPKMPCERRLSRMEFLAVDFETANWDLASICQVGTALYRDGEMVQSWGSLVNPEDEFDPVNVSIHGIDETMFGARRRGPTSSREPV